MTYEAGSTSPSFESRPILFSEEDLAKADQVFEKLFHDELDINSIDTQKLFFQNGDILYFAQDVLSRTESLAELLTTDEILNPGEASCKGLVEKALLFGYHVGKTVFPNSDPVSKIINKDLVFHVATNVTNDQFSPQIQQLYELGTLGINSLAQNGGAVRGIVRRYEWKNLQQWTLAETATGLGVEMYHMADCSRVVREVLGAMGGEYNWDAAARDL